MRKQQNFLIKTLAIGCLWIGIGFNGLFSQTLAASLHFLEDEVFQTNVTLPYKADAARTEVLLDNMNALSIGLSVEKVRSLLGSPDEIEAIFKVGERTEELEAFEYVYLIAKEPKLGVDAASADQYLRINFNLSGLLQGAHAQNVEGFHDLVRELGLGFQFSMGLHETVQIDDLLIHLDFILDEAAGSPRAAESMRGEPQSPFALFTLETPERKEDFKLMIDRPSLQGQQSKYYGKYKINMITVSKSERVVLIVE